MGIFNRNNYGIQDEAREPEIISDEERQKEGDLACEEAIMKEKERFGRVRTSLMQYLRVRYHWTTADRALRRVNKRIQENYFR